MKIVSNGGSDLAAMVHKILTPMWVDGNSGTLLDYPRRERPPFRDNNMEHLSDVIGVIDSENFISIIVRHPAYPEVTLEDKLFGLSFEIRRLGLNDIRGYWLWERKGDYYNGIERTIPHIETNGYGSRLFDYIVSLYRGEPFSPVRSRRDAEFRQILREQFKPLFLFSSMILCLGGVNPYDFAHGNRQLFDEMSESVNVSSMPDLASAYMNMLNSNYKR